MDLGLWNCLGKVKLAIIAKFHRSDLVICSNSREGKTLSYSQINMVNTFIVKILKIRTLKIIFVGVIKMTQFVMAMLL